MERVCRTSYYRITNPIASSLTNINRLFQTAAHSALVSQRTYSLLSHRINYTCVAGVSLLARDSVFTRLQRDFSDQLREILDINQLDQRQPFFCTDEGWLSAYHTFLIFREAISILRDSRYDTRLARDGGFYTACRNRLCLRDLVRTT